MLYAHTITVFNRLSEDDDASYAKSVVTPVLFVLDENTARNKLGLVNADTVTVYIPQSCTEASGKALVDSFTYDQLADKSGYFTFKKGDYVSLGGVSLDGLSINEFKNTYGNIYEITGLADYRFGGLPNLVLSAK